MTTPTPTPASPDETPASAVTPETPETPTLPFTDGRPCIVVPVVGTTLSGLHDEIAALHGSPAQLVEWRADLYREASSITDIVAVAREINTALIEAANRRGGEPVPLLFTYRSRSEGGQGVADERDYAMLIEAVAGSGAVAAVDVEFRNPQGPVVIDIAQSEGAAVIASAHDFERTPPAEEIVALLADMEAAGADVAKVAVMPRSPSDVLTLLDATHRRRGEASIPLITMAMGPLGALTRLGGEVFGSAATFATVGEGSAPGQLDADTVASVLDLLHAQLTD